MLKFLKMANKKKTILCDCDFCGKQIEKKYTEYHRNKHHFCSDECFYSFNRKENNHKYNRIEFNCDWCGKKASRTKFQYNRAKKHYCSNKCREDHKNENNVKTICYWCGKEIVRQKSVYALSAYHFCSSKCKCAWHSAEMTGEKNPSFIGDHELICDNCGKEFIRTRKGSRIKEGQRTFCTRKCEGQWNSKHRVGENSPSWKGGVTPIAVKVRNSKKYLEWRSDVFKRDNYTCQKCRDRNRKGLGRAVYLQADHGKEFNIIMRENNIQTLQDAYSCDELWDVSNGNTLCIDCHNEKPVKIYKEESICLT